jgi:hypothetical protein
MEWVRAPDKMPPEGEYVMICIEGYVGISRYIDGEWDVGNHNRRPMYRRELKISSKLDAEYWMPLPIPPTE